MKFRFKLKNDKPADFPEHVGTLNERELAWRDKQPLLEYYGYMLRPRYKLMRNSSWESSPEEKGDIFPEDAIMNHSRRNVIDAIRIADGKLVQIKRVTTGDADSTISGSLSSPRSREDFRNHSVPVLEMIRDPGQPSISYVITPFLRPYNSPPLRLLEDVIDLVEQLLEGLIFLHEHGVAHRALDFTNVRMDASELYPDGFHPIHIDSSPDARKPARRLSRAERRVTYYIANYEHATHIFIDPDLMDHLRAVGEAIGEPGLLDELSHDLSKVDIFMVGKMLRELREEYPNLDWMDPLIRDMTSKSPNSRPDALQAYERWRNLLCRRQWSCSRKGLLRRRKYPSPFHYVCDEVESAIRIIGEWVALKSNSARFRFGWTCRRLRADGYRRLDIRSSLRRQSHSQRP